MCLLPVKICDFGKSNPPFFFAFLLITEMQLALNKCNEGKEEEPHKIIKNWLFCISKVG